MDMISQGYPEVLTVLELRATKNGESQRLAAITQFCRSCDQTSLASTQKRTMRAHTVGTRDGSGGSDGARSVGVCTVRKLVPIVRVWLQVLCLYLDGKVDIVRSERLARINWFPGEFGVIEDLERDTDRDALIRTWRQRYRTCPQKDGIVEWVTLQML